MTKKSNFWGYFTLIILLGQVLACQNEPLKQTSLPDEKIARIMADLSIAEAATNGLIGYAKDSLLHVYIRQVFEIHTVTPALYEENLRIIAHDLLHIGVIVSRADSMLIQDAPEKR